MSDSVPPKAYQSVPTYTALPAPTVDYGELFRCHADEIRLLKRLRNLRSNGCQFVLLDIDALELRTTGRVECYGRAEDKRKP